MAADQHGMAAGATASPALAASGVVVRYGKATAVRSVDISISPGTITGLVGPNGAGKSSLLNAIQGVVRGDIRGLELQGRSLLRLNSTQRARSGLVLVPQGRQIFPKLTVVDNLRVVADGLRLPKERVDEALDRFPILRERRKRAAGVLSGGEQQMLVLARALMSRPGVLMLDEPTQGLAPTIVQTIMGVLEQMRADDHTILVAEPTTRLLPPSLDRGFVMVHGQLVAEAASIHELESAFHRYFEESLEQTVRTVV
jgi:branched-chain amino acid transport system ATP-binding protein